MVMAAGETVNVSIGTLPAGKSVTIVYDVTVNDPLPPGTTSVSQQGTVSGSNFSSVLTDDPKTGDPLDPTVTQIANEAPVAGFGKALSFDGTNQYVLISDAGALNSASYTVEAWVRFNAIQDTAVLQRLDASETGTAFGLFLNSSGNFVHYADNGTLQTVTGTTIAEVGKWYHIAGTFSGGTMRLFVNGLQEGTPLTGLGSLIGGMDHFNIGKSFAGRGANYLNGQIDEIRIWNAEVSNSDLTNWMYRGIDPTNLNYSSLVAYYKLDNGTGSTAADSKGANNGALQNMTNANWVDSTINEWFTNENVAFSGKLVGSDAEGASNDGTDWALTFELVTDGTLGHVVIGSDNNFTYTPNAGQSGDDTFTYKVKDSVPQDSNISTVKVHIAPVPDAPVLAKAFGAPSIPLNGTTTLTFTVSNPDLITSLSNIAFSDTLPAGLVIGSPAVVSATCVGTITAPEGSNLISMTVSNLAAGASCNFVVNVTGTTAGTKNNTTSTVTTNESVTGSPASASIDVVAPPVITKAFGSASILLNGTTSLTITITNPAANAVALTGVAFTDPMPGGIMVVDVPFNSCSPSLNVNPSGSYIWMNGNGTVAVNSSCTIVATVQGTSPGLWTNTTTPISSVSGGVGNSATADISVGIPPVIAKVFGAATIPLNGSTSLTFTISNPAVNPISLTGIAFTDNLPAGLVVSTPNNLSNTCSGTATAAAGSSVVSLTGATLAPNTSCILSVNVTGTTAGTKNNSVTVTSVEGGTGNTSNASITVVAPPVITKAFGAVSIPLNGSTSLTFTITNPATNPMPLTGLAFTDILPAGLVVSTPHNLSNTCGGGTLLTSDSVRLTTGTLAALTSCTYSVDVTGTTSGIKNNVTGNVTSIEGGTGGTASANLQVTEAPTITSADTTTFVVGAAGTFTVTATGYPTLMLFTATGTLPTGVTLVNNFAQSTATLEGTPAAGTAGIYPITITAFNGVAPDATQNFTLTVLGGKMSRNSWYLSPEGWIVYAFTKPDAPNELYLEVIDTGNNLVNPLSIAGMTTNPKLIASDAVAPAVSLSFNVATRIAYVTYTSAAGRQVVTVTGIRQAP